MLRPRPRPRPRPHSLMTRVFTRRAAPVWQSHTHAAAIKADPSHAIFLKKRQVLASGPIFDFHVRFSGNPRRTIESPVAEVDIYRLNDAGAAETQERIRRLTYRIESLQMRGFIALSWGVTVEDGARGIYLGGWRTVEVRVARALTRLRHPVLDRFLNGFFFSHRNTCVWAR